MALARARDRAATGCGVEPIECEASERDWPYVAGRELGGPARRNAATTMADCALRVMVIFSVASR